MLLSKLIDKMWNIFRVGINRKNIKELKNFTPSIISSNCNGAVILHDLNLKFLTPTVDLYIKPKDFIKLASKLEKYLNEDAELVKCDSDDPYPVGRLIDIEIHFMHYKSFEDAKAKWIERSKRVQYDNIFLMMTERDGCTYEDMVEFDKLPYKKVIFTSKPYPEIKSSFYVKGFENMECVGVLTNKNSLFGTRYIDVFDYVSFLNENLEHQNN